MEALLDELAEAPPDDALDAAAERLAEDALAAACAEELEDAAARDVVNEAVIDAAADRIVETAVAAAASETEAADEALAESATDLFLDNAIAAAARETEAADDQTSSDTVARLGDAVATTLGCNALFQQGTTGCARTKPYDDGRALWWREFLDQDARKRHWRTINRLAVGHGSTGACDVWRGRILPYAAVVWCEHQGGLSLAVLLL